MNNFPPIDSAFEYMPVEVGGQVFALPLEDVLAVHRVDAPQDAPPPDGNGQEGEEQIPLVDLRQLFGCEPTTSRRSHLVGLASPSGACALLVDGVSSRRQAAPENCRRLPPLLESDQRLFGGLVLEPEDLLLVVDASYLAQAVRCHLPLTAVEAGEKDAA